MSSPAAFPPPPPPDSADGLDTSPNLFLQILAVIGLTAAAVMTLLWLNARADSSDSGGASVENSTDMSAVQQELDDARDELEETRQSSADTEAEVERLRTELTDALASLAEAEVALDDASGDSTAADGADDDELLALQEEIDRLTAENTELAAANGGDEEEADGEPTDGEPADGEPADGEPADGTSADEPTDEAEPVPETTVAPPSDSVVDRSPLEIGTLLGGTYRENVLGQGQRRCLGDFAVGRLGSDLDEILASDDPGADERLIEMFDDAAPVCRIDPSAIFG